MVVKRTPTMITPKRDSWSAQNGEVLPAENEELEELMRREQEQDDAADAAEGAQGEEGGPKKSKVERMIDRLLSLKDMPAGTNSDLTAEEIISVCTQTRVIFLSQPMFLGLGVPLRICGDIHGQFTDLLKVLDKAGYPGTNNYLFLGDYVDRGRNSIEAMMLLLCYKLVHPEGLFLLRGNHESAIVNQVYGFYDECKRRYSTKVYRAFCDVFNTFPVAALVADSILCMHGGISPSLNDLDDIEDIVRPCEVPSAGLMADLLWADPDPEITGWRESERGISYCFGKDALEEFMLKHDLDLIVRAHQVVEDGYEFFGNRKLVTIFTAPNYCGEFDNAGAMVVCDEDLQLSFEVFPAEDM